MRRGNRGTGLIIAAALALIAGCATTTHVETAWTEKNAQPPKLNKVLVVAIVPEEAVRRNLEEKLAEELQRSGVAAQPASQFIETGKDANADALKDLAAKQGFDTVLVSERTSVQPELHYDYPFYDYVWWSAPYAYGYGAGLGYGYPHTQTRTTVDTRLFDLNQNGELVWAAVTETVDGAMSTRSVNSVAKKIVDKLAQDVGSSG